MNSGPWVAHSQYQYARMLLRRSKPADVARANELIDLALSAAESLGMQGLLTRIKRDLSD